MSKAFDQAYTRALDTFNQIVRTGRSTRGFHLVPQNPAEVTDDVKQALTDQPTQQRRHARLFNRHKSLIVGALAVLLLGTVFVFWFSFGAGLNVLSSPIPPDQNKANGDATLVSSTNPESSTESLLLPTTAVKPENHEKVDPTANPDAIIVKTSAALVTVTETLKSVETVPTTIIKHVKPSPKVEVLNPIRKPEILIKKIDPDIPVIGLVFYGRRDRVAILDCYLKQNLKVNGGRLEKVIFVVHTDDKDDSAYLDELIKTEPHYSRVNMNKNHKTYGNVWEICERGKMYVKIDDDVVYIGENAIASMVQKKIDHPEHLLVSANVINNPFIAQVHLHIGAIRPFLPELPPSPNLDLHPSWRPSELPVWNGSADWRMPQTPSDKLPKHRWLPLPPGYDLDGTPIVVADSRSSNAKYSHWDFAAQQHASFLENLEKNELHRYDFSNWYFHYRRLSINMIAVLGDDMIEYGPVPSDDEEWLTRTLSRRLGRHITVDGSALAVHFSFYPQVAGMHTTDFLERYESYAIEEVCKADAYVDYRPKAQKPPKIAQPPKLDHDLSKPAVYPGGDQPPKQDESSKPDNSPKPDKPRIP